MLESQVMGMFNIYLRERTTWLFFFFFAGWNTTQLCGDDKDPY